LVNEVPEIYADSLYGRGLAFLELGDTAKAIEDLSAAAETPQVGAKARAALEEARRRASGRKAPAEEDPEALLAHLGELVPRAAGGDAAAEKQATALARGLVARASDASLTPAYEQALDAYLSAYPSHDGAAEARYLLAELHRARGDCKRAEAEYGAVGSGPFAARARLGGLECRVVSLGKGSE